VEGIALQLDFASDTALRNMIKRYTGLRAQDLRHGDGASVVLAHLRRALASHRDSHRAWPAPHRASPDDDSFVPPAVPLPLGMIVPPAEHPLAGVRQGQTR
jgi:hypothetical protein